jgi:transcriptional regulator with XRE-family HTH domain
MTNGSNNLGKIIKQRRLMAELTLQKLSLMSGVSASELGRIERGERFPSATILRKIAKPLDLGESELFIFAGYLSPQPSNTVDSFSSRRLDPYVANVLSQEPLEVQRIVLAILSILKSMTKGITQ